MSHARRKVWVETTSGRARAACFSALVVATVASTLGFVPDREAVAAAHPLRRGTFSEAWSDRDSPVPVTSDDPMWGRRDAPVTVVEYGDVASRFSSDSELDPQRIQAVYGADKVRIVWKTFLARPDSKSRLAAEAMEGVFALAGSAAFWDFERTVCDSHELFDIDHLTQLAQAVGVDDSSTFREGLEGHRWAEKVNRDVSESRALGLKVAPSLAVNGLVLDGPQPFVNLKGLIDRELATAQKKMAAGTPASRLYVEISKERERSAEAEQGDAPDDGQDSETVFAIPLGHGPVLGPPEALVTLVEFGDFRSRFCASVEPTLRTLRDKYKEKLRIVWRNARSSDHAIAIAEAVSEARAERGDEGFWMMHDELLARRRDLVKDGQVNFDVIAEAARESGIDPSRVQRAMRARTYERDIEADTVVAERYQAKGTPHFFINGRRLAGAQPQSRFERIVDEEIAKANLLILRGVRATDIYATLTRDGRGPPAPRETELSRPTLAFDYARHKAIVAGR